MAFEDVIATRSDFKNMLCIGKEYIASDTDPVVYKYYLDDNKDDPLAKEIKDNIND